MGMTVRGHFLMPLRGYPSDLILSRFKTTFKMKLCELFCKQSELKPTGHQTHLQTLKLVPLNCLPLIMSLHPIIVSHKILVIRHVKLLKD